MGARGFKGNAATKRGLLLEDVVSNQLKKKYPTLKKCGVILRSDMPMFAASPDGMSDDFMFEIKCPYKDKTITNYIENDSIKEKVYYQMQLQMLMANKEKGILCVADLNFEKNKKITQKEVALDRKNIKKLVLVCTEFWRKNIFPLLK